MFLLIYLFWLSLSVDLSPWSSIMSYRNWTFAFFPCFSLITTPPPERVPIKTHLSSFSKEKVKSAIKYELERGGQVFYVLPRIKGNHCTFSLRFSLYCTLKNWFTFSIPSWLYFLSYLYICMHFDKINFINTEERRNGKIRCRWTIRESFCSFGCPLVYLTFLQFFYFIIASLFSLTYLNLEENFELALTMDWE